jgi:cytochrome c biogenesis protein CcmG/thiol:disulfide interchange protein DsbE
VACGIAVLVAVLATSGPASQVSERSPLIGKRAPTINGQSLLGAGRVELSSFSGRWVLVNFAASWCFPCRQEMPQLQAFEQQHAQVDNGVILSVAYDEGDVPNLVTYLRSQHASWLAVDDGSAVVNYGVRGIPESYLIDPQGTVVAKYVSGVVASQLDAVMAKASGGLG